MPNYHIVAKTSIEKYHIIDIIRTQGATLTGVSGYGSGYYIQMDATSLQASAINLALSKKEVIA
jgi:hypothetical protein